MNMYRGTPKFDREQLIFVVDTILTAATDRAESCLPSCVPIEDYFESEQSILAFINGTVETAAMGLAIFFAQLSYEGIGAGDVLDIIGFREFIQSLVAERTANGPRVTPDGKGMPDCRELAEKYVDEMFSDYLGLNFPRNLKPGDEVTWNDPDGGLCTKTAIISEIKYREDDIAWIRWQDGTDIDVLLEELS